MLHPEEWLKKLDIFLRENVRATYISMANGGTTSFLLRKIPQSSSA
jgi:hypothetical protein